MKYLFTKLLNNRPNLIVVVLLLLSPSTAVFSKQVDELLRIEKIALSGKYFKNIETAADKVNNNKQVAQVKPKKTKPRSTIKNNILVSDKKVTNKNKNRNKQSITKNKKLSKKKNKFNYCLGGSYKALAKRAKKYDKFIAKYSSKYDVSPYLIKAVITAESCFNSKAVSPKGAQGLMQLMPPTAKRFGISDSFNSESNIKGGTRYLKFLMKYFDDDMLNVIAAYNAGEGAVNKYKGIPPYKETKNYVFKVATLYKLYSQGKGDLTFASVSKYNPRLVKTIFVPRAMPSSRFSPYKDRRKNIERGNCANRTSTRLRKSTFVEGGNGIWQRIYRVQQGDTLLGIMQKTGVHKSKISRMNGLRSRERLKKGQQLLIWECRK